MTDTELLDGLQRLFQIHAVAVLRTCRSGVKLEWADGGYIQFGDESIAPVGHCEFFGTGSERDPDEFGSDIRGAIRKALSEENRIVRKPITPHNS